MKKILIFIIIFLFVLFTELWILKKNVNYIPQFEVQYISFSEQDHFQWIRENEYYYKKKIIPLDSKYIYTYPLEPLGYIKYSKVGEEIEYYISEKQLFWRRSLTSYPYFEPYGKLILGVNADRTKLTVLDINGNILKEITGIFLVDLNCSYIYNAKFYCYSLFSDGKFDVFNEEETYSTNLKKEKAYFKSFSIKNKEIAFHYYFNDSDIFEIYKFDIKDGKISLNSMNLISSKILFPYTISFTFNKDIILFPNFKETIIIKNDNTYKLNIKKDTNSNSINFDTVQNQNEITIDTNFIGESKAYKNLIFIMKNKTLEIYDQNGNFLFYWDLIDSTNVMHIKDNLYIFLDKGYLSFKFI